MDKLETIDLAQDVRLFVNVYAKTFEQKERMCLWLERFYRMFPHTTCVFEILEHHLGNVELAAWTDLKREFPLIELAQDDFGIGEQDLIRFLEVKPDWLKLDSSWMTTLSRHPESVSLLQAIVDWAGAEGIKLIAEGIETSEQSYFYSSIGIEYEQGYFWSVPQREAVLSAIP